MFVKVFLVSQCVISDPDPIPLSNSESSPQPCKEFGYGLINMNQIESVFPFDGDLSSDLCIIHLINEDKDSSGFVSDDFQKIKSHFYLEF